MSFIPGDVIVYEANPDYREADQVAFSRVELKGGGDAASAARAVLQTGDVDYANNLQVEANVLRQLEAAGQGQVVANFGSLVERIVLNFTDPNQATAAREVSTWTELIIHCINPEKRFQYRFCEINFVLLLI